MTITWPELVVLMGFGDGREDTVSGLLRVRDVNPIDDESADDEVDGDVERHPVLGRIAVHEAQLRVSRRGQLLRVERPDGRVSAIFGADTTWLFEGGGDVPVAYDAHATSFGWAGADFVRRLPPSRWEGDDFTRLTGPIEDVEYLGRPAYAFELAPPRRKPYPLQLIVDAQTGIVLRQANRDFGSYEEWLEVDVDADLGEDLFRWDGPTRAPHDWDAEHEAEQGERQAWLDAHGLVLEVPVRPELMLHEHDDATGAFEGSFHASVHGSLIRRPSADPIPDGELHYPHAYRWSDSRWAWLLSTVEPVADEQLALLKVQLAKST